MCTGFGVQLLALFPASPALSKANSPTAQAFGANGKITRLGFQVRVSHVTG